MIKKIFLHIYKIKGEQKKNPIGANMTSLVNLVEERQKKIKKSLINRKNYTVRCVKKKSKEKSKHKKKVGFKLKNQSQQTKDLKL